MDIQAPNNIKVNAPWIGGYADTPRFYSLNYQKNTTIRDCIQRSETDSKLYRCIQTRFQQEWVQVAVASFTELPDRMPSEVDIMGGSPNNSVWNCISLPGALTHGRMANWDFAQYSIKFDRNTRVYEMSVTQRTYGDVSKRGGDKETRELLAEDTATMDATPVDT